MAWKAHSYLRVDFVYFSVLTTCPSALSLSHPELYMFLAVKRSFSRSHSFLLVSLFFPDPRPIPPPEAVPKRILEVMGVPGLTRENVASHLQVSSAHARTLQHEWHTSCLFA